jgi:predicted lactoylglutathione lyase
VAAPAPQTAVFAIGAALGRDDLPGLCDRVRTLLERSGARIVVCDLRGAESDAVTVDALAQLQLAARRRGCEVRLRHASTDLLGLVAFMGLGDVLLGYPLVGGWPHADESSPSRPSTSQSNPPITPEETMPTTGSRKIFVNVAVKDLQTSVAFFTQLGFTFEPRFTDETATCMVVSDEAFVMLLVEERFKDFTKKALCDATTHTEAILALSAESRQEVDELVEKALAAGGRPANEPMDHGFMYLWSFQDPDAHLWEVVWMDPAVLQQEAPAGRDAATA